MGSSGEPDQAAHCFGPVRSFHDDISRLDLPVFQLKNNHHIPGIKTGSIPAERKAESPLNPLQSYLDQVIYEEDRFSETCEDNPFLKQLGKLFRYYGYQARTAIDQLRTDMFTGYLAFRTVFILQSNGHILYALTEPILALLSEPQEGGCHEEDDPLE